MKRAYLVLSVVVAVSSAQAQTDWTMEQCMQYAVAHGTTVLKSQVAADNDRADYRGALMSFLPTVTAGTSGQYSWGRNVDPETNTYNTITTFNNYYQLYADLTVFDGGRTINAFRQAKDQRQQSMTNIQKAKDDKAIEVMQKYVDAVYAQACIGLAEEKLADSRDLLKKTQRQEELGVKGYPEVAQIEAQVAEDDYNLTHQQNLFRTALLALKSAMNFPTSDSLRLWGGDFVEGGGRIVKGGYFSPSTLHDTPSTIPPSTLHQMPVALTAEYQVRNARYNYQIAKGRILPTVSLSAGVTTSYYKNLTSGGTTSLFHRQWHDNMGEYVAATLRIPLFDGAIYRNVRRARNDLRMAELERDETLRKLHDDVLQAVMDRNGCRQEIRKMERKAESDSVAWQLSRRKFEEGMLSAFDLHTAANTLLQSRVQLLQLQLTYAIRQKLVEYFEGKPLY